MPANFPTVMARGSLSLVHDALVITTVCDVMIDELINACPPHTGNSPHLTSTL